MVNFMQISHAPLVSFKKIRKVIYFIPEELNAFIRLVSLLKFLEHARYFFYF